MEKFLVVTNKGHALVNGERCTIAGVECFSYSETQKGSWGEFEIYHYAHLATGYPIARDFAPDTAREKTFNVISMNKETLETKVWRVGKTINV